MVFPQFLTQLGEFLLNGKLNSFHKDAHHLKKPILTFIAIAISLGSVSNLYAGQAVTEADPIAIAPPEGKIPENLVLWPEGPTTSKYAIIADKSQRTLTVWENQNGIAHFVEAHPMDIGKRDGDKEKGGDHRTPEGIYFPHEIYEGQNLNFDEYGVRAFALDYPNYFDQRNKKTGSGIWLHAIPDTKSLLRGSRGCVVVRNDIIKKLSPMVSLNKTPVIISDQVNYVTSDRLRQLATRVTTWFDGWKKAWSEKSIENYISNYAEDFFALNMNRNLWKTYKSGLNEKYSFIEVKAISPALYLYKDEAILKFLQDYKSDTLSDFGQKTLYLSISPDAIKIRGEEWQPASSDSLARINKANN